MRSWQAKLADAMHYAIYVLMLAVPVLRWRTLSAAGKPIVLIGLLIPSLTSADVSLSRPIKDDHEARVTPDYVLIGLHGVVALLHHCVMHDNTLVRMLIGASHRN